MRNLIVALATFVLSMGLNGCATAPGDTILELPAGTNTDDIAKVIATAKRETGRILERFGLAGEDRRPFDAISPQHVIRDSKPVNRSRVENALVLAAAGGDIAFVKDSIIIALGPVTISHSAGSVIVVGADVDVGHDGGMGPGSVYVSKGKLTITHARGTLLYAVKGVEIAHPSRVRSFNTTKRITSWGTINNTLVEPLFQEEGSVVGR